MIEVSHLSKEFDDLRVIDDMSFSVGDGESLAIIGPSGCGKTTLLYILAGLVKRSSGDVNVSGREVDGPTKETAFILQDFGLLPWRTVRENVALGLRIKGVDEKERERRVASLIAELGLEARADDYPSRLSGGEKQRTAIARALALDPQVLLMDEPFSSLDTLTRERLQEQVQEIWSRTGKTMVFVTHSIEEAVFLGQRIMVLGKRPCSIKAVIPNPEAGARDFRTRDSFFDSCKKVRAVVEG
jgi:NitT/TauT family transport system ATP-binding protein